MDKVNRELFFEKEIKELPMFFLNSKIIDKSNAEHQSPLRATSFKSYGSSISFCTKSPKPISKLLKYGPQKTF